jgi:hypothetical protein
MRLPESYALMRNGVETARVVRLESGGWYWYAMGEAPFMNTAHAPVASKVEAQSDAVFFVRKHLDVSGKEAS